MSKAQPGSPSSPSNLAFSLYLNSILSDARDASNFPFNQNEKQANWKINIQFNREIKSNIIGLNHLPEFENIQTKKGSLF